MNGGCVSSVGCLGSTGVLAISGRVQRAGGPCTQTSWGGRGGACWPQEAACPLTLCLVTSQQPPEMQPLWGEGVTGMSLGSHIRPPRAWDCGQHTGGLRG